MNAQHRGRTRYDTILSAWREQLITAARNPTFRQRLLPELLPRFAAHYTRLLALPRRARREMQLKCKESLAGVALLLALGQAPAFAASINVGGGCSLVDAITAANTDIATGGCTAGGGADTLVLVGGSTHTLTAVNNTELVVGGNAQFTGPNGLPVIKSEITIDGNGATITRNNSAPDFRIFAVNQGASLTIDSTTVTGGRLSGNFEWGGGVLNAGILTLTGSTISSNSVLGQAAAGDLGGGVFSHFTSTLTVANSTISGNVAGQGGGIFNGDNGTITNSNISGNSASGSLGGGVNNSGVLVLTRSTVSGNSAATGGGLFNGGGTLTATNTTISGNSAAYYGAGLLNGGDAILTHCTITGNTASEDGGGLYNAAPLTLKRTLISGNSAVGSGPEVFRFVSDVDNTPITADAFNLFGFNGNAGVQGFAPGPTDIVPVAALAGILDTTLANNGGSTQTHALVSGPAVNAVGSGCPPPATDQRGIARPQGAKCDIGAFEFKSKRVPPDGRCAGMVVTIMGTQLNDALTGTNGPDVIQGLAGNDRISGLRGNDTICGGVGNDSLVGDAGNDQLFGDAGNDRLAGSAGNDALSGGAGKDQCDGGSGGGDTAAASCETVSNVP